MDLSDFWAADTTENLVGIFLIFSDLDSSYNSIQIIICSYFH